MSLKSKKVVVTGAGGFIGSHLVEELLPIAGSVKAFTINHELSPHGWLDYLPKETLESIELVSGDIRDPHGVISIMKDADVVFHLAALISIPFSYSYPELFLETNVRGTLNVLQAARQCGVEKIVHTSTSEVYGTAQFVPITESHPLNPQSPYAASKISADHMALAMSKSYALPVVIVRPFNTFGPRQSTRAIIPTIITQILRGERSIRLGSIHTTRDFTYVKDTVKGFVAAACSEKAIGEVVHLSSNFEISIQELVETIATQMGVSVNIEQSMERLRPQNSEVERLWGSNEKARNLLHWQPQHVGSAGFRSGLKEAIDWFSDNNNLACYNTGTYLV